MDATRFAAELPAWVQSGWSRSVRSLRPTESGMKSSTAIVDLDSEQYVAKWVPTAQAPALTKGSLIARRLAQIGLATANR